MSYTHTLNCNVMLHTVEKEFILMHDRYNLHFKSQAHGRINFY